MVEVENRINQFETPQKEIMYFFHNLLTKDFGLTDRLTFNNPCYYNISWICYLKPLKNGMTELAFMRGNELSNENGLLKDSGRKQLRSIEFSNLNSIELHSVKETLHEAILLDEAIPYKSKRKK